MSDSSLLDKVAAFWNQQQAPKVRRTRWWESHAIVRHINTLVCGEAIDGVSAGFHRLLARGRAPFRKALSIGCGVGVKEIGLLRQRIVESFHLYEISGTRLAQLRKKIAEAGIDADVVSIVEGDAFALCRDKDFDLVYWNNALHHMVDVGMAIRFSQARLRPGGVFAMDDFVGPSCFQWPHAALNAIALFRCSQPRRLLLSPSAMGFEPVVIVPPSIKAMREADPSEAADSERILPELEKVFPDAEIILTGGYIYHTGLNDILQNFPEDGEELEAALRVDALLSQSGLNQYAVAIARKA
jgi:SAM-dependent methyltransferase